MDLTFEPQLAIKVSPRLVAANHILELSSLELQQVIAQELHDNPALEKVEEQTCGVCGGTLEGNICPHCLSQQRQAEIGPDSFDAYDDDRPLTGPNLASSDEEFDPLAQVADQMTLAEHLMMDLQSLVPPDDLAIAEYLVGNLDDRGWLACDLASVASFFGVPIARVGAVLKLLQMQDPIGIGARDLRECLLIQLDFLEDEHGRKEPIVRKIIENHLTELGEHKFGRIAQELRVPVEAVQEAFDYIKGQLNPYPARQFAGVDSGGPAGHVLPDVIINPTEDGYDVEVLESRRYFLRVTPLYQRLAAMMRTSGSPELSEDERKHIQQYVARAKLFIQNINQRRQTLQRITACLVERQREFLDKGIRHLMPLTRAAVAAELGLHESTVSRATAAKFVMLPNRQVIPFSLFFTASMSVKDVIKEIIEAEGRPLTDQDIAQRLEKRGIHIARRTVAKYRDQLGILPSSLR